MAKKPFLEKLPAPGDCICFMEDCPNKVEYRYTKQVRTYVIGTYPRKLVRFVCPGHAEYLTRICGIEVVK